MDALKFGCLIFLVFFLMSGISLALAREWKEVKQYTLFSLCMGIFFGFIGLFMGGKLF